MEAECVKEHFLSKCMLLAVGACALVFHVTHAMSARNSFEEKKSTLLRFI